MIAMPQWKVRSHKASAMQLLVFDAGQVQSLINLIVVIL